MLMIGSKELLPQVKVGARGSKCFSGTRGWGAARWSYPAIPDVKGEMGGVH